MEHIIQFGVTIDDKKIEEEVTRQAVNSIRDEIEKLGKSSWQDPDSRIVRMAKEEITKYVNAHEDEIVEKAIDRLTQNMLRTKKVRDAMDKVVNED